MCTNISSCGQQNFASEMVFKMTQLGIRLFPMVSSICILGWGAKELLVDTSGSRKGITKASVVLTDDGLSSRIKLSLGGFFERIRLYATDEQERKRYVLHGAFFVGSGTTGIASQFNFGSAGPLFQMASNTLFVMGNIVSLELNIRKYFLANEMLRKGVINQEQAHTQIQSAYLGILNNLGYIFCAALILYGLSTAIALIVGCVGCFFGCIKILYDLRNF